MNAVTFGNRTYSGGKINDTVWDDLNFGVVASGGPVATRPDDVKIGDVYYKEFTSANNQLCSDQREIPHSYKLSSKIYPHLHLFLKSGESSGTTGVTFTFYWELRQTTGATNGSATLSRTSAQLAANGNEIIISDATGFNGPAAIGSQLAATLARTGGDAGDIVVTTYGVHYEIDAMGSDTVTEKFNGVE